MEPLSDSERLEILTDAVRRAVSVMLNYIDPANGVSRDDALNDFIEIFDSTKVARAAGMHTPMIVDVIGGGRSSKGVAG